MTAKIAIPYSADGSVFQHFGKAESFKIYNVEEGALKDAQVLANDGQGHEMLGVWLVRQGVNAVVCGGIGAGAQGVLAAAGIVVFPGVEGAADEAIAKLIAGTLQSSTASRCSGHHDGASHCSGHNCNCSSCHH